MNKCRDLYNINGVWNLSFVEDDYVPTVMASDVMSMAVPASYNEIVTDMKTKNYVGKVLYEREFSLPVKQDFLYRLRISATSHRCDVYLNGEKIGVGINGFIPIDLPLDNLKEKNRLSIIIDNRLTEHTLPNGRIVDGKQLMNHDFYNFTGIHRDVLIYSLPKKHIEDIIIDTVVDNDYKKVAVTLIGDDENACFTVIDQDGKEVVKTKNRTFEIQNPRLWQVGNSYLYTLAVETDTDYYEETFGIRKVEVKGNEFLVNDKVVYFKGFGLHEDFFVLGKGNNTAVTLRNLECLKWINANSFRTSHYPYSEEVMDLADKYGFMVIEEAPAAGMVVWEKNFGKGAADDKTLNLHKEVIKQLYERDKNHPSVVMFSVANEPQTTEKESEPYFREVFEQARKYWKVPITFVDTWHADTSYAAQFVDVICVNRYLGWYSDHGDLSVVDEQLRFDLDNFYNKYKKPLILTEFGADTIEGMHSLPAESFTEDFQTLYVKENCETLDKLDYCIGEHVWNFADFKTNQGLKRVGGNRKGVFTKARQPKMVAYYLKERWGNK